MVNNYIIDNTTVIERNFLLLTNVRCIVKFYIWPLFALFGLTGNCLSILVLTRRRLIRTSTNNYLTILAAFDSCYLIITLILNFGSHPTFSQSAFTQTLLFLLRPLADFSSNTATWLIVCFTLERTLAVAKPIYAKRTCSVRRSRHVICTLLIICFLITLPTYFENYFISNINDVENRNITFNITQNINLTKRKEFFVILHRSYLVFICVIIIWIPLILVCICNSILIWYVHHSRRFNGCLQLTAVHNTFPNSSVLSINKSDYSTNNYHKTSFLCTSNIPLKNSYSFPLRRHSRSYVQKRKVTIVLIFCLFVALLLWTPQSLSLTYETLIESYSEMPPERRTILLIFNNFANLFLCINASIDFILYCFLSEKFARTCRQMICRTCSNDEVNSCQRSRIMSLDRTSFILTNLSNNPYQQQLINNRINNYDTQLYHIYHHSLTNQKNKKSKINFIQRLTKNNQIDNQISYRTALIGKKKKRFSSI
ncbi:unnamed protein product [Rotaria sordida]|uniref:G-protein coupled receptors family 1 profile domain-containing protein n=1 Tax=Rotaria sordida TaxID=392033 RepID=A0A819Q4M9_9BILA|nr:unnamed protein product [Rotaria sordida]